MNNKEYFYMLLTDVTSDVHGLDEAGSFEPSNEAMEALETLHDDIGVQWCKRFSERANMDHHWERLSKEYPAIEKEDTTNG